MTFKHLNEVLEKHKLWLNGHPTGEKANFSAGDLILADLKDVDLRKADLVNTNLRGASLMRTDLRGADLSWANFEGADLSYADLSGANLSNADLKGVNLSGATGLISTINFIESHFERTADGIIAYKTFNYVYTPNPGWKIEPGSIIEENVNFNRTEDCGCGINVAPLEWVRANDKNGTIWKVLIRWEWLCGVCVPYMSDGKIRCERVELLEIVE